MYQGACACEVAIKLELDYRMHAYIQLEHAIETTTHYFAGVCLNFAMELSGVT